MFKIGVSQTLRGPPSDALQQARVSDREAPLQVDTRRILTFVAPRLSDDYATADLRRSSLAGGVPTPVAGIHAPAFPRLECDRDFQVRSGRRGRNAPVRCVR